MDNCTIIPQDNNYYISHHPPLWLVFVMLAIGIIIAIVVILILYRFRTYIWKLVSGYCRHRVCSKLYLVHCLFINGHFMSGYTEGLEHFYGPPWNFICANFSHSVHAAAAVDAVVCAVLYVVVPELEPRVNTRLQCPYLNLATHCQAPLRCHYAMSDLYITHEINAFFLGVFY